MTDRLLKLLEPGEITRTRVRPVDPATLSAAAAMLDEIEARGDTGVLEYARRFGDLSLGGQVVYSRGDLGAALKELPRTQRDLLERTADRIRRFALAQRECLRDLVMPIPGGEAGHTCLPVCSVGCYAPGGRFPLPSSVLMTAITARAAGVPLVWVASPRPTAATLAAAAVAGADGLLAIGGVQAIAALARGLVGAPACDMIVGPGNRWVTAAKQLVSGEVGIDMLAGPSELVVLADESADPALVAADLLAQAEHDDDAVPILVSTSARLADAVELEIGKRLIDLPTRATACKALRNGGACIATDVVHAIEVCDRIGPEHLEIMMREPESVASRIRNAGAVFIGSAAAEVLGDYGAGPNHVLPTGGSSRFRAGLSVFTFLRARTWLRVDDPGAGAGLARDAAAFARVESLAGHVAAAELRGLGHGVQT